MTARNRLTALGVEALRTPGRYTDGGGLFLLVRPEGSRQWVLRLQHNGHRRDYGLGGYPQYGLKEARQRAEQYRRDLLAGRDVVAQRRFPKPEFETFRHTAEGWLTKVVAEAKYSANSERIARARLETYAFPKLGHLQLQSINADAIADALRPIWLKKHETAVRVRELVIRVLRFGLPDGYRLKGTLASDVSDRLPPRPEGGHREALPYADLPAFMVRLAERNGIGTLALQFAILTAARSREVREASWNELDLEAGLWTVPASHMKAKKAHRVPLPPEAVALLGKVTPFRRKGGLVFPSIKGKPLSDMTLTKVMRDMKADAVPHGFRSTFRDWAAEQTSFSREVIEACLAHTVGNDVELAYKRTDFLEKRRALMDAWGAYCIGSGKGELVAFPKGKRSAMRSSPAG